MYNVVVKNKVRKNFAKLPRMVQEKFCFLLLDLESGGPEPLSWANYSKLDKYHYHCHLNYHYVA